MALFSRRPKDSPDTDGTDAAADAAAPAPTPETTDAPPTTPAGDAAPDPAAEAAASVSISVSSYGGLGSSPAAPKLQPRRTGRAATKTAPANAETVPGLRDNVLVREALARLGDGTAPQALLDVARQMLQGHLFLRIKGDARSLLAEGRELPLAVVRVDDARQFALAYSSGAALQASVRADGDVDTSAMGQPVLTVLRHVLDGPYEGLIIDQSSAPARAVLPRPLLEKVMEKVDEQLTVKTLLAAERTPETPAAIADALTRVPFWVAVGKVEDGRPGLAEGRAEDGSRYLEVYSHPVEIAVMGRGDQAAPLTGPQLARALDGDPDLSGIIVDPAGPWIRLTRDELAPVFAAR